MRPGTKKPSQTNIKYAFNNPKPVKRLSFLYRKNSKNFHAGKVSKLAVNGTAKALMRSGRLHQQRTSNSTAFPKTALLARRLPIDMSLPGNNSLPYQEEFTRANKWQRLRVAATTGLAIALVLVMTLGGLLFSQNYIRLHKVFRGEANADVISHTKINLLKGQSNGRINVLILGRDGIGSKPNSTDTMVLASIDVVNNNIKFISLPDNLWVSNTSGTMTISDAFSDAMSQSSTTSTTIGETSTASIDNGFKLADQSVDQVLGTSVDYNMVVNLQAVEQIVDSIGGIQINIPSDLVDPTMAWQNGGQATLFQAGSQTLNGKQALVYAMSKETTSESDRDQRQRAILTAIFTKVLSAGTLSSPAKVNSVITSLGNNVATDLSMKQAAQLYKLVTPISPTNLSSIDLFANNNQYITSGNMNGQSISLPATGLFSYGKIHSYVTSQLPNPYLEKEDASILILNGTNTAGLATNLGNKLSSKGYNVTGVANASSTNWSKTSLYNINKTDLHTQNYLEKTLKVKVSKKPISKSIPTDGANFVIIIGNNETSNT